MGSWESNGFLKHTLILHTSILPSTIFCPGQKIQIFPSSSSSCSYQRPIISII